MPAAPSSPPKRARRSRSSASFLPKQLSEADMAKAIDEAIAEAGATSIKDMGKVMAALKSRYAGQMDFGKASGAVKAKLG